MKVKNTHTGVVYDEVPFVPCTEEEYKKRFKQFVPEPPFKDPLADEMAAYLYMNPILLLKLLHHKKHYNTYFPVYIDGKKIHPTQFSYSKEFLALFDTLPDSVTDGAFWEKVLPIAILKLTGKLFSSAGAN